MDAAENHVEINSKPDRTTSTGNQEIRSNFSSPLSSPTHEFSFTITLRQSPTSAPNTFKHSKAATPDFAPADDIFFHGHLLPLHRLPNRKTEHFGHFSSNSSVISDSTSERKKSNSFSIRVGKWFEEKKKKKVFDLKALLKRYTSMVEFFGREKKKNSRELSKSKRPYSFSGNADFGKMERERWMKRRGEMSAPVSMKTSPTNSGHLLATPTLLSSSRSSESSMEELQNAIQAAIAHCKNSGVKQKEM